MKTHQKLQKSTRVILIAVLIAVVISCLVPVFVDSPFVLSILINSMISACLAISFLVAMRPGLVNMTIPAFWGVGAYASAILCRDTGMSSWAALPLAILITGVIAFVLGYVLIHGSGSSGFSFVMMCQVVCMMFAEVIGNFEYLGRKTGFQANAPSPIHLFGVEIVFDASRVAYYYYGLIMLFICILVALAFYKCWIGRAWTAIGMSARLADSIGINRASYKLLAFVVSSCIAGFAGAYYTHFLQYISPSPFSMWKNIYVQIYAIMGGVDAEILGPLVGGTVMTVLPQTLQRLTLVEPLIEGIILVLLILFMPKGIMGLVRNPKLRAFFSRHFGKKISAGAGEVSLPEKDGKDGERQ